LDFIVNYDIKYRMGQELEEEIEGEECRKLSKHKGKTG